VTTSNLEETGIVPRGDVMKRWSANKMFNLPLINIDQSKNLFNRSVSCPAAGGTGVGFSASVSVDAHAKVNAQVAFGFTISGSIIPPKVKNAQILGCKWHLMSQASLADAGFSYQRKCRRRLYRRGPSQWQFRDRPSADLLGRSARFEHSWVRTHLCR